MKIFASIAGLSAALALAAFGLGGCTTDAYCFRDCDGGIGGAGTTTTSSTGGTGGSQTISLVSSSSSSSSGTAGAGTGGSCDTSKPASCGTCSNDCYAVPSSNWDPSSVKCDPGPSPGMTPGTCSGTCAADYWNLTHPAGGLCDYYCVKTANDDKTCDGLDDDCDGQIDEDVDLCTSVTDCGACGRACSAANATTQCQHTGANPKCDPSDTACAILACTCTGPGNCFWDADGMYANGCEYACDKTNGGVEICDGLDNDCDGVVDDNLQDPAVGVACQGGTMGACADPAHAGTTACVQGKVRCAGAAVVTPGQIQETCNGVDDDCNGLVDDGNLAGAPPSGMTGCWDLPGNCCSFADAVTGKTTTWCAPAGATCNGLGALVAPLCGAGVLTCAGASGWVCKGARDPQAELCNGLDEDCDGVPDDHLADPAIGASCCAPGVSCVNGKPPAPPAGATSACKAGATVCQAGVVTCAGAVGPSSTQDGCNVDANCDGALTGQPDLMTDVNNCGSCGHACRGANDNSDWACQAGACVWQGCPSNYYDIPANHTCSYFCVYKSATEVCNGVDDNCDGKVDENIPAASPTQVCGINPGATTPECTTGITTACVSGKWQCSFSTPGVCSPSCAQATDVCDGLDNNCNGLVDENTPNVGQPCASDTGKPPPGDGVCRTTGVYVCNGPSSTKCNAVKDLSKAGPELCDGLDNDCDGLVDEPFTNKGSNPTYFVKPTVTQVGLGLWVHTYEASRPSATGVDPGSGNGYWTSAPSGKTLDQTPACSVPKKIPWFNVTGPEADQTCTAMGGHTCSPVEWETACEAKTMTCTWGYSPNGARCTTPFSGAAPFCNLAYPSAPAGVGAGLLETGGYSASASPVQILSGCSADWSGTFANTAGVNDQVYDITGNLREITFAGVNQYTLMGGAFDSSSEAGAACSFTFYNVDQNFQLFDTGFRCCFNADPTQ